MHILETSALIDVMNSTKRGGTVMKRVGEEDAATTAICVHEALVGEPTWAPLLGSTSITVLPFDCKAAVASARLKTQLKETGKMIQPLDVLIAGICIAHDHTLVTCDKGFLNIKGLRTVFVE